MLMLAAVRTMTIKQRAIEEHSFRFKLFISYVSWLGFVDIHSLSNAKSEHFSMSTTCSALPAKSLSSCEKVSGSRIRI